MRFNEFFVLIRFISLMLTLYSLSSYSVADTRALQYSEFTLKSIDYNYSILANQSPTKLRKINQPFFLFNPAINIWSAYNARGKLIGIGKASGGHRYCKGSRKSCKTPVGDFRILRKGTRTCYSTTYPLGKGGAPMPYCMFFKRGYAIHASQSVPDYNASHGCIRVTLSAAKWLHQHFIQSNTLVVVLPYAMKNKLN